MLWLQQGLLWFDPVGVFCSFSRCSCFPFVRLTWLSNKARVLNARERSTLVPETRFDLHFMSCVSSGDLPFVTYSFVWWPTSGLCYVCFSLFFKVVAEFASFTFLLLIKPFTWIILPFRLLSHFPSLGRQHSDPRFPSTAFQCKKNGPYLLHLAMCAVENQGL